jgi:hypothetical protein
MVRGHVAAAWIRWRSGKNRRPKPHWRRRWRHPEALAFDEVVETLKALRDLPELLSTVDTPTAPRFAKGSVLRFT